MWRLIRSLVEVRMSRRLGRRCSPREQAVVEASSIHCLLSSPSPIREPASCPSSVARSVREHGQCHSAFYVSLPAWRALLLAFYEMLPRLLERPGSNEVVLVWPDR